MSSARLRQTIFQCLSDTRSNCYDEKLKALQTMASITKVSPQNRNLLAQTHDAITTLLTLSKSCSSSSSEFQILSLSILFNLSLNPNLKDPLADLEIISHLNSLILSPGSLEVNKLTASLICSLAMLDKNKAKFGVSGTIQSLVKSVSWCSPASHHLLSSLAELVQFHGNCTLAVQSGAVELLINIVESVEGEDLAGISLAILGLVARFEEGISTLRKTDQIVSKMLQVLKGRCMLSKEGAADILVRLFEESEGCLRDAMRLTQFSTVLADISVRGSTKAREKTGLLMKKMVEANLDPYLDGNMLLLL